MPCHLLMEHLNWRLKNMVENMERNASPQVIVKAAKSFGPVQHVCSVFEGQTIERKCLVIFTHSPQLQKISRK